MLGSIPVSIVTLSDEHIKNFSKCPYRFYFQDLLKVNQSLNLQQMIQITINQIIKEYYHLPLSARNSISVLKLIDKFWKNINSSSFHSQIEYYSVLANLTDQLLKWLKNDKNNIPLLFLYEKQSKYIEELGMSLSVCFEVVEWSNESFIVKKFLFEENEFFLQYFYNMLIVFADKSFGRLPEIVHVYCIENGKKYTYIPKEENVTQAIEELKLMKDLLSNSSNYVKSSNYSDCHNCPLKSKCSEDHQENRLFYI